MSLDTGSAIIRHKWKELPIPTEVVTCIEKIAEGNGRNKICGETLGASESSVESVSPDDTDSHVSAPDSSDVDDTSEHTSGFDDHLTHSNGDKDKDMSVNEPNNPANDGNDTPVEDSCEREQQPGMSCSRALCESELLWQFVA